LRLLAEVDGVDVYRAETDGAAPLHTFVAAQDGHAAVVALLLAADGLLVNKTTTTGITPLYIAAKNGHASAVEILLAANGVDENQTMANGVNPLHIAAGTRYASVVEILLAAGGGITVNAQMMTKCTTSLHLTAITGHAAVVKLLSAAIWLKHEPNDEKLHHSTARCLNRRLCSCFT